MEKVKTYIGVGEVNTWSVGGSNCMYELSYFLHPPTQSSGEMIYLSFSLMISMKLYRLEHLLYVSNNGSRESKIKHT